MKSFLATLLLAAAMAPSLANVAKAQTNCYTNCYWLGDVQYCNTTCN